ncbi:MAG: hypothetical protein GXP29_07375 [Planctomycetes bacterium]|nr:hypothetical protein [Planctomycetota bacterium]
MIWERTPIDPRRVIALRAIRETNAFLTECVRNPDRFRRIPVVRVGFGSFPPGLAGEFWSEMLAVA